MSAEPLIHVDRVSHYYGEGALRRQILFAVSASVHPGEIVILTGPSGSGKTTLLTLMGGLRSTQEGSLRILDQELKGASERALTAVRRQIGYIFQAHNLLEALTARENVARALALHPEVPRSERYTRSTAMLEAVGLGERIEYYPRQLSGGQKQRVAIARALVSRPKIILADEPTASLDKQSGREVVEIMHDLAKQQGCAVLLVTHDNRILDIADRIIHLEDGRISSFTDAVLSNTRQMFSMLEQSNRHGELMERVAGLPADQFATLLEHVTAEFQQFLHLADLANHDAFEQMLEQVLEAFTFKIGQILEADRASLFLVDTERRELWSKVAQGDGERPLDIRVPLDAGIAGRVASSGQALNIADAYAEPLFNRQVDERTGYRTRSILCVPITDNRGQTFAVAQLLNRRGGGPFAPGDEKQLQDFSAPIGVIVEMWRRMSRRQPPAAG